MISDLAVKDSPKIARKISSVEKVRDFINKRVPLAIGLQAGGSNIRLVLAYKKTKKEVAASVWKMNTGSDKSDLKLAGDIIKLVSEQAVAKSVKHLDFIFGQAGFQTGIQRYRKLKADEVSKWTPEQRKESKNPKWFFLENMDARFHENMPKRLFNMEKFLLDSTDKQTNLRIVDEMRASRGHRARKVDDAKTEFSASIANDGFCCGRGVAAEKGLRDGGMIIHGVLGTGSNLALLEGYSAEHKTFAHETNLEACYNTPFDGPQFNGAEVENKYGILDYPKSSPYQHEELFAGGGDGGYYLGVRGQVNNIRNLVRTNGVATLNDIAKLLNLEVTDLRDSILVIKVTAGYDITNQFIDSAAKQGDKLALKLLEVYGERLAQAMINILGPEKIKQSDYISFNGSHGVNILKKVSVAKEAFIKGIQRVKPKFDESQLVLFEPKLNMDGIFEKTIDNAKAALARLAA